MSITGRYGRIVLVEDLALGSSLAADATAYDAAIFINDWSDFGETGTVVIDGGESAKYSALNEDTGELTLEAQLLNSYVAGVSVILSPRITERTAWVISTDSPQGDEQVPARVPHSLYHRIKVGVRGEGAGEIVELRFLGDTLVVADILGETPDPLESVDTTRINVTEEFLGADAALPNFPLGVVVINGTGAAISGTTAVEEHPGILTLGTGTTAGGYAGLRGADTAGTIPLKTGRIRVGWLVRIPTLSTGTQRFATGAGLNTVVGGTAAKTGKGAYFYYKDDVNSGKFQAVVCDDIGNIVTADTGVTVEAGTWYMLEVEITSTTHQATYTIGPDTVTIEEGLYTATFFLNDEEVASITPYVGSYYIGRRYFAKFSSPGVAIEKTVGTTERTMDVDFGYVYGEIASRY